MFCPKCGRMNNDEYEVCKGCGALLHTEEEKNTKKKNNKNAVKSLIAAAVAVCVMIGASACVLVSCDSGSSDKDNKIEHNVNF